MTAAAIQQALAAARAGRLHDGCRIAELALVQGGDPGPLNALIGMLRLDLGDAETAVRHLQIAHQRRPSDIRVATNLANAFVALEEYDRALEVATPERTAADPSLQLIRIRGFAANQAGQFDTATEALERVVSAAPDDWESWNNLGNARRGAGDLEGCLAALEQSIRINPLAAPSRLNHSMALRDLGRLPEAEAEFRRMASDFPDDAKPLRELHLLLKDQGRDEDALDAIATASAREPQNIEFLLAMAAHQSALHRMEAAEASYRRVLRLEPDNATAFLGLALVYELSNRADDLGSLIAEAERANIAEATQSFMRAYQHRRAKEFEAGLGELEQVPDDLEPTRRLNLLGQLLEGAGRYDEAFDAFTRMNALFREDPTAPEERGARYRNAVRGGVDVVDEEWLRAWRDEAAPDPRPAPVFLVGFPRSGTTLLDTMLMGHPRVEVLEEEPPLREAHKVLPEYERLPSVSDAEIGQARDKYFEVAGALTPLAPGHLLVDKNPLTMNLLPFVRRLFPGARIILSLRHPCDVVLSCFMANFRLNDGMANFLTLESTADLYDASFRYYEHVQKLMPLPTHVLKYEDVVADRETELRRLFDFLRLDWHDAVLDHQSTALKRGRIKTASYSQVVEPIYTRSAGRWEHYRKHLEPVLPVLRPWAEKFGYAI